MKTKISFVEGFYTSITRESIEIDTDDYPELEGLEDYELLDYLESNCEKIIFKDSENPDNQNTLYDILVSQDEVDSKEKYDGFSIIFDEY